MSQLGRDLLIVGFMMLGLVVVAVIGYALLQDQDRVESWSDKVESHGRDSEEEAPKDSEGSAQNPAPDSFDVGALDGDRPDEVYVHPSRPYLRATAQDWVKLLFVSDPVEREQAAEALISIGPPAVPYLTRLLGAERAMEDQALNVLERMGNRAAAAVPALLRIVGRDSFQLAASYALAGIAKSPPSELLKMCEDQRRNVRLNALNTLVKMKEKARPAITVLVKTLRGEDAESVRLAARALAGIGPETLPVLRAEIHGGNAKAAINALASMGPAARAVEPELLRRLETVEPIEEISIRCALARITGNEARQRTRLIELTWHVETEVRCASLAGLGQFNEDNKDISEALVTGTRDKEVDVRLAAVAALEKAASGSAMLLKELKQIARIDLDERVRDRAERIADAAERASKWK